MCDHVYDVQRNNWATEPQQALETKKFAQIASVLHDASHANLLCEKKRAAGHTEPLFAHGGHF